MTCYLPVTVLTVLCHGTSMIVTMHRTPAGHSLQALVLNILRNTVFQALPSALIVLIFLFIHNTHNVLQSENPILK